MVALAYSRQIRSPEDLISRLRFTQIGASPTVVDLTGDEDTSASPTVDDATFQKRFEVWLLEFLRQPGYTTNIVNVFPDHPKFNLEDQHVLRARLLLHAASGSELLPLENDR